MFIYRCIKIVLLSAFSVFSVSILAKELTVSAAASLNNAFKEIAQHYEASHPDTKIILNFAASGTLLQQIARGAPVDVFASADQETMDQALVKQLVNKESCQDFIENTLVVIVPKNSSLKLTQLSDMNENYITHIAVGNPNFVPAGRYTKKILEQENQWDNLQNKWIYTQNVRQALDYVARGEVEAGFVYGSDAYIMKNKVEIAFAVPTNIRVMYPIVQVKGSKNPVLANDFIAYVLSVKGQSILEKYGFQKSQVIQ